MPDDDTQVQETEQQAESESQTGGDVEGLKRALEAERKARKAAERERAALSKYKEDTENASKSEMEKLTDRLTQAERRAQEAEERAAATLTRADFIAKAVEQGVRRPEAAYKLALADGLLGKYDEGTVGSHDFAALKKEYPELFQPAHNGKGDTGTGSNGVDRTAGLRGLAAIQAGIEASSRR